MAISKKNYKVMNMNNQQAYCYFSREVVYRLALRETTQD